MNKKSIIKNVEILKSMYDRGMLGGEVMPEDANPGLPKDSLENYLYFTLPMALNYQRNSYKLWESALKTYLDKETNFVFSPKEALKRDFKEVQSALTKYKVALQKEKQTEIWLKLCEAIVELFNGDIRKLFVQFENDVNKIRNFLQKEEKKRFPYLSGTKICNYWLYVIWQYTTQEYQNIEELNVAPDTHVIKSTYQLGLITEEELDKSNVQEIVIEKWNKLLKNTKYKPIDIHTALWLWSRNGFRPLTEKSLLQEIKENCAFVSKNSNHIKIKEEEIANLLKNYPLKKNKHWLSTNPFHLFELSCKELINFLIVYDAINFSFWGSPKWSLDREGQKLDGSIALIYALLKLQKKYGHLNFEKITYQDFKKVLEAPCEIPFLKERYEIVKEVSHTINTKMNDFYEYTKQITKDEELIELIIANFPSFKDERDYKGQKIKFYKLAQLVTSDILHIREMKENIQVDYSNLVGCADYKIPQALRALKILEYDEDLSSRVDGEQEIKENEEFEVEIRANTIIALQKIQENLPVKVSLIEINDFIWSLSQKKELKAKPYHKTRTMSY